MKQKEWVGEERKGVCQDSCKSNSQDIRGEIPQDVYNLVCVPVTPQDSIIMMAINTIDWATCCASITAMLCTAMRDEVSHAMGRNGPSSRTLLLSGSHS